jgi:hypothetical protein
MNMPESTRKEITTTLLRNDPRTSVTHNGDYAMGRNRTDDGKERFVPSPGQADTEDVGWTQITSGLESC